MLLNGDQQRIGMRLLELEPEEVQEVYQKKEIRREKLKNILGAE